ncbi:hypothetical protein EJ02DRAFT_357629 [Clathrospora elynae]|uniref:Integral membrane protein n=1 Tax=Clathrospora elynae TaxID=706981 RepID=A0A6A5SBQ2_9PLEO|nr:hypothetical protein EJ02DRAFT_357629 [Clathrospora elynae]
MTLFILVSLAICFSVGPILSSTLTYLDIRNYVPEYDYRWERIAGIVFGIGSTGLGITGIIAIATAPYSTEEGYHWLDAVIIFQLVRLLQIFISPCWAIWAIHLVAISTILDIVSAVTGKTISSAYKLALLSCLATALLLSLALLCKQLETQKNLGLEWRDQDYVRLLHAFVFTNAAAASIQLCGAIIVSSLSLAGRSPSTQVRQGIFMLLCHLPFYITRIWRRLVVPLSDQINRLRYSFSHRMTRNGTF